MSYKEINRYSLVLPGPSWNRKVHATQTLTVRPAGDYAISLYYDENNNGTLDSNFIGIPKEPVALSNNARPKFGPPKYRDAVFALEAGGTTQKITIESI